MGNEIIDYFYLNSVDKIHKYMYRRQFIKLSTFATLVPYEFFSYESLKIEAPPPLIKAPGDPGQWSNFIKALKQWKKEAHKKYNYNDHWYDHPDFGWVTANFNCFFLMMYDLMFYDPRQSKYTVDKLLDKSRAQFGRIDSLVLWHAYPRIGVDNRNQFDFYRDMPGGLQGIRQVVEQLHDQDIKVFINYNPWDTSTRREDKTDPEMLVEMIDTLQADGIFLDTLNNMEVSIRKNLNQVRKGVILESELDLPVKDIETHHCSWAQWFEDSQVPGILRNKWYEPRHMQHQVKRWDLDHSGELHMAWMNGSGMMLWENVFGSWVGWSERDKSILKAMSLIQKYFYKVFTEGEWQPLVLCVQEHVYANRWENNDFIIYTLVNRSNQEIKGTLLEVDDEGFQVFNAITGEAITVTNGKIESTISPRGISGFILQKNSEVDLTKIIENISQNHKHWREENISHPLKVSTVNTPNQKKVSVVPTEMVEVPAVQKTMTETFRVRECGFMQSLAYSEGYGVDKIHQNFTLNEKVDLKSFAIDRYPVTNQDFAYFLEGSGYLPTHAENFLKHWKNGKIPNGLANHPVVYVCLEDARAYAEWVGKRLPANHEWTYAAQGNSESKFPWGEDAKSQYCNLDIDHTTPVDAYPNGVTPFGCFDMIGNTWEWTESEHSDGRTRFCLIKGGSNYDAKDSKWYISGGPKPSPPGLKNFC